MKGYKNKRRVKENKKKRINNILIGYYTIFIDSRGHGHSTRDSRPLTYDMMADDVLAVLDALGVEKVYS